MVERVSAVPEVVDVDLPSSARVYDYLLGGGHNFAVDRATAERLLQAFPVRDLARLDRSFLRRAVLALTEAGITQFLDLGSGIPTVGNVHEVAQGADPECRVVYVDFEPVAITHSELLLAGNRGAGALLADLRSPEVVLTAPETRLLLDFDRPVGLLAVGVLQSLSDADDPWGVLARYRDALAPGSYLALSHLTSGPVPWATGVEVVHDTSGPVTPRTREQVLALTAGFELVEPGLVFAPEWRPESPEDVPEDPGMANLYAAVGRKP